MKNNFQKPPMSLRLYLALYSLSLLTVPLWIGLKVGFIISILFSILMIYAYISFKNELINNIYSKKLIAIISWIVMAFGFGFVDIFSSALSQHNWIIDIIMSFSTLCVFVNLISSVALTTGGGLESR